MNKAQLGTLELGYQFTYRLIPKKRNYILETFEGVQIQHQTYIIRDEEWEFEYPKCSASERNVLLNYYKTHDIISFRDYDGNTYSVIIVKYSEVEKNGLYYIEGVLRRILWYKILI